MALLLCIWRCCKICMLTCFCAANIASIQLDNYPCRLLNLTQCFASYQLRHKALTSNLACCPLWFMLLLPAKQCVCRWQVSGYGDKTWLREQGTRVNAYQIEQSVNDSLQRLQTDHLDLLQIHWPDRWHLHISKRAELACCRLASETMGDCFSMSAYQI